MNKKYKIEIITSPFKHTAYDPMEKGMNMNMRKSICTHCYHQDNCPVDPNYKAERAPTIITTCTAYDPAQDYYEQGTQSIPIDEFTEALLDWLETPKSK